MVSNHSFDKDTQRSIGGYSQKWRLLFLQRLLGSQKHTLSCENFFCQLKESIVKSHLSRTHISHTFNRRYIFNTHFVKINVIILRKVGF